MKKTLPLYLSLMAIMGTGFHPVGATADPVSPTPASAPSAHFDMPAMALADAIKHLADQLDWQVFFRVENLAQIHTRPLQGQHSPRQALQRLLQGTGLTYTLGPHKTLVIRRVRAEGTATKPVPSDQAATNGDTIEQTYVTGLRQALKRRLAIKRRQNNLVDAISAEDIGQFPDQNVADSLQRIPGVSVDRLWGEGRDVNIRGTDKDINRTLLNGQHVASAYWWANDNLSRGFNYTTLASPLVESLQVHKTPRADMDEGSIGGTVLVTTRKPLAMDTRELHASLEGQYNDLSDHWAPQASVLGSWKNRSQTLGVLASINWQNRRSRRDGLETFPDNNLYNITDTQGRTEPDVYAVWGGGSALLLQDRQHTTTNLTLQWAPDHHWETTLNLIRSDLDIDNVNHNFLFTPGGYKLQQSPPARVANPQYRLTDDGRQILAAGTLTDANSTGAVLDAIHRDAYVDTQVNDLDIHHQSGPWRSHWQMGHTRAKGGTHHDRLYRFTADSRVHFDLTGDSVETDYLDLAPSDPAALTHLSPVSRDWIRQMQNRESYVQYDGKFERGEGVFHTLKWGLKFRDNMVENSRTVGTINTHHPDWPTLNQLGLAPISGELSPALSRQSATEDTLTQYILTSASKLRTEIAPYYQRGVMDYKYDRSAFYRIDEQTLAQYLSAELESGPWQGDIGIRHVTTWQSASAFDQGTRQTVENHYDDWLPSLNLRYHLSPHWEYRLAVAQVMARPNFKDLTPNIIVDPTSGSGAAGNPKLNPYRADQLDLGVEWYPGEDSIVSAVAFYKDISTFIYPRAVEETVNGQRIYITRPQNGPGADIHGLELQWQQSFSSGVGMLTNYTYTHASVPSPDGTQSFKLPGNSKSQFNASVYYERGDFNLRLSYNYRSRSFGEIIAGSQTETAAYDQWDANFDWPLNDSLTLTAEAVNLTDEVIRVRSASGIVQGFYENGRRFLVGIRFSP